MAGDRNIPRGLRIPAGGWLHSVDLQEQEERGSVFTRLLIPSTFPRRDNNLTMAPKPSFSSSLAAKGMTPLFQPQLHPLPIPAPILVPIGPPIPFMEQDSQSRKRRRFCADPPESRYAQTAAVAISR